MSSMNHSVRLRRRHETGFTLMELLIALAVVSILTAVAVPSYGQYVLRSARADARATLLQASQFMERFYAINSAYDAKRDGTPVQLPNSLQQVPQAAATPRYAVTIDGANLTATGYSLQALPVGASSADKCGTLTMSSTGVRGASGATSAAEIADCWR